MTDRDLPSPGPEPQSLAPRTRVAQKADDTAAPEAATSSSRFDAAPHLDSAALLRGNNSVAITHRGTVYRLQATRQGKLILTK
ncbi:MAG: hemin uptake protein HemP [Burkholderiaceae bacterium]